jgi:hypothetical protein
MSFLTPSTNAGPTNPTLQRQPPTNSQPHRPLRREGAFRIENLTAEEQALEDAMNRSSSPPPEVVLGKQIREGGPGDGSDTDLDDDGGERDASTTKQPSISNVTTSTQRHALKKKLRPEQRDELDAFLLVSFVVDISSGHLCLNVGDAALGRQAKLFTRASVLALENNLDTIRSAAPPYQLFDELKVCLMI